MELLRRALKLRNVAELSVVKEDFRLELRGREHPRALAAMSGAAAQRPGRSAAQAGARGVVFDVDGTLLLSNRALGGYELLPGAIEVLSALARAARTLRAAHQRQRLSAGGAGGEAARQRGCRSRMTQMFTPSSIAADLMRRRGIRRVLVLGVPGVGQALRAAGIETLYTGRAGRDRGRLRVRRLASASVA